MTSVPLRPDRDPADPLIGRLLDNRYQIGARIARGGMASVYEAVDTRLDRTVAVKVMHPGMAEDPDFAARFVREARAAAKLHHPNVVAVFDQGEEHGTVFLVMEFVPGETLRDVIRRESPMKPQRALELLEPVLTALAAAHRAKLIHRDIKPENVLIPDAEHGGGIKVADFGLAKAVNSATQHTATGGVLIGTVSYVAPELVVDGTADTRADVYAAGVVLYEMLTGRKPHEGESPIQVAYKHVHEDVPAPSAVLKKPLPAYVDALVQRATARDRGMRPADARVLLHQVHRVKQALDEGVVDDPELVADLALPVVTTSTEEIPGLTGAELYPSSDAEHTQQIDRGGVEALPRPTATGQWAAQPPERRRKPLYLALAALLLLIGLIVAFTVVIPSFYTTTPGVLELRAAEAKQKIEDAGLTYEESDEEYHEDIPAGSVISTDPGAGERIREGGTVHVTISLGRDVHAVPDVAGKSLDDAIDIIEEAELTYGRSIEKYSEKVKEGYVIRSSPTPLDKEKRRIYLDRGAAVDLIVSKGPRPIEVRDYTGKPLEDAQRWFDRYDLKVEKTEEFSEDVAKGSIISQDPTDGELFKGDTVTVVVSKGPPLVDVPNVLFSSKDRATKDLEKAGFDVAYEKSQFYSGADRVVGQSPLGGQAPKGSTITLFLA